MMLLDAEAPERTKPLMQRVVMLAALIIVIAAIVLAIYIQRRRSTEAKIRQAYASVITVEDYLGTDDESFAQADIAAREKLDVLESRDLGERDQQIVACVGDLLGALESLKGSHSLETTTLRTEIAKKAVIKASDCMQQLK